MKIRKKLTLLAKKGKLLLGQMLTSAGYFSVDDVRVLHFGMFIDQEAAAEAIRLGIKFAKDRYDAQKVDALLRRITVRYYTRPVRSKGAWLDSYAAWKGGNAVFDRGVAHINYLSDDWKKLTAKNVAALIYCELQPSRWEDTESVPTLH